MEKLQVNARLIFTILIIYWTSSSSRYPLPLEKKIIDRAQNSSQEILLTSIINK